MHLVNKKIGETPLELINRLKNAGSIASNAKATYAGRLDPLASGLMIILVNNEVHTKEKFLNLDKSYTFDLVLGIETDSYDPLGIIKNTTFPTSIKKSDIETSLSKITKLKTLKYPPYSSRTVKGKPLWQWAKEGRLNDITIPEKEIKISTLELNKFYSTNPASMVSDIIKKIERVNGDFRQIEIINRWKNFVENHPGLELQIANITINCSSGTYVRSLADHLGETLNTHAIASNIVRTKIGSHNLRSTLDNS